MSDDKKDDGRSYFLSQLFWTICGGTIFSVIVLWCMSNPEVVPDFVMGIIDYLS